ncbi:MAG: adenylate/guanylate cyclase domain-containing protein, partial [Bacteroidales bacterium]
MGISFFRRFVLSGALFCAGAGLNTLPALAAEMAAGPATSPDESRITGVCSYRTGESIDTSGDTPVLKFGEGIIFRMVKGEGTEYSFYMEGPDREWTAWSDRSYKEYTNLGRGSYIFMYRYRTVAGETTGEGEMAINGETAGEDEKTDEGESAGEGSFGFRVKAPWYFSPLAWIIYPLLLILAGMMLRIRTHRLFMERQKRLEELIAERTEELQHEKEKSDNLLANMLPKGTAEEIMLKGKAAKTKYNFVTVLFSDIQGFTRIAEEMNPEALIDELDRFFFHFDSLAEKYRIEKIKTIGDAYMCAGGIPERNRTNPVEVVLAALEMQKYMQFMKNDPAKTAARFWDIRIGIHTGTVIAGVVGHKKITFDIWGDTVNTASRMESSGEPGKINISGTTYEFVKDYFICDYRGRMPVKY